MKYPLEVWEEARRLYENEGQDVMTIARRLEVSRDAVYLHAKTEQWVRPLDYLGRLSLSGVGPQQRKRMIARLYGAFERQVRDLEARLTALDGREADDRDARTLATLAQTLDRLVALDASITAKPAGEADDPEGDEEPDIDEFRRDLARRLETIRDRRHRGAAAGDGPADD